MSVATHSGPDFELELHAAEVTRVVDATSRKIDWIWFSSLEPL